MLVVKTTTISFFFLAEFGMKIELISQRREMLLNVNCKPAITWSFLQWRSPVSVSNTDFFKQIQLQAITVLHVHF